MKLHFKYGIYSLLGLLLALFVVQTTEAQICTGTSDGTIQSLLGTDFDRNTKTAGSDVGYSLSSVIRNTPAGVRFLPDGGTSVSCANSFNYFTYDGDTAHYSYDWLKANNAFSSTYKTKFIVTDSLRKMFPKGKGLPFNWKDGENSFFVTSSNPNGWLCGIYFPYSTFKGRKFTVTYRFYIIAADSTMFNAAENYSNPSISVGAHNAAGSYTDNSNVVVTIAADNGDSWTGKSGQEISLTDRNKFPNCSYDESFTTYWGSNWTHSLPNIMTGYTVTYDINFADYGAGSDACLAYFPYLNINNANDYRIVFDYVNVAMEHLCISSDSICPGDAGGFTIHAVDYSNDAEVDWQYSVNGSSTWTTFNHTKIAEQSTVSFTIPSDAPWGTQYTFRTYQTAGTYNTDPAITGGYSIPVTATVAQASQCAPPVPEFEVENICAGPANWNFTKTFKVTNATSEAAYNWTLISPSGKNVSSYLEFDNTNDPHHTSVTIHPTDASEEGVYSISVFARAGTNTDMVTQTVTKTFTIYQTPRLNIRVMDEDGNNVSNVCPSALHDLKYIAYVNPYPAYDPIYKTYNYVWENADPIDSTPYRAHVDVGALAEQYCQGIKSDLFTAFTAYNHGCPSARAKKSLKADTPVDPEVHCSEVSIPTLYLSATATDTTYTFPVPSASAQCGEDLTVNVSITSGGKSITATKSADGKTATATFPIGESTITFSTTDNCSRTGSCSVTVLVKDTVKPSLNCDLIPDYTTYLSYFEACEATPGEGNQPSDLPVITAPVLEDLYHPGDRLTGKFVSRTDLATDVNAPFQVGKTTITWSFADASGNKSYCTQDVTVINDRKPSMTCSMPDTVLEVSTDLDQCGAYSDSIIARIDVLLGKTPLPSATNACKPLIPITPKMFYTEDGGSETEMPSTGFVFKKDVNYTLIWRFYNNQGVSSDFVDGTAFDDCVLKFIVRDHQKPTVSCTNTTPVIVTVNITNSNGYISYDDYASGRGQSGNTANKTYSLKGKFDNMPTAFDACPDNTELLPVVYMDSLDSRTLIGDYTKSTAAAAKAALIEKLEKMKFYANTTSYISFVFTDADGNKDSCVTQVTVVDRKAPIPNCWETNQVDTVADASCKAVVDLFSFTKIPTASISVTTQTSYSGGWAYSTSTSTDYTVYPVKIVRQHYAVDKNGKETLDATTTCENDGKTTTVPLTQTSSGWTVTVNTSTVLQTSNFKSAPECLNTTFDLGKTVITLYYANGQGDTSVCVATVNVKDVTPPTVECGTFANTTSKNIDLPADQCELSFEELGFGKPTLEGLSAADNCTPVGDLTLSYLRTYKGKQVDDLETTPYQIGTNIISWIVTDASGNSTTCTSTFEIRDVTGPQFNCDDIKKKIVVYADEMCQVPFETLVDSGMTVPSAPNDNCSPAGTSSRILASGTRSDGKSLYEPYSKADSPITITWIFTDGVGNMTTCYQSIVVKDTTGPVFPDCGNLPDLTYYLEPGKCTVDGDKVKDDLGSHSAYDNCDGEVKGVAGVGDKGKNPLPAEYKAGTTVVVWKFTDNAKNTTYCYQNVVVKDTISPDTTGVCPQKLFTFSAKLNECEFVHDFDPVTIDNDCDGVLTGVFTRYDGVENDTFPTGSTDVYWTFTDKSGNSSVCTSTVYVKSTTPPIIYCNNTVNDSLVYNMTTDLDCGTESAKVVSQIQIPYAVDACTDTVIDDYTSRLYYLGFDGKATPTLEVDAKGNPIRWDDSTYVYQRGYTQMMFIFTDVDGNADTCKYMVIVRDLNTPEVDCDNIVSPYMLYPAPDECTIPFADIDLDELNNHTMGRDHCTDTYTITGKPVNQNAGTLTLPSIPEELMGGDTLKLWWYYIADAGGISRCPQTIIVTDTQAPYFDCSKLQPITLDADDALECYQFGAEVLALLTPYPRAKDNCGDTTGVPTRSDGLKLSDQYPTGTTTITWTFYDSNPANTRTCTQDVLIKGIIAPEIECDTFKTFHDSIPECDERAFSFRTPYGFDKCAPDSLQNVAGVGTRSDGKAMDDPYPLGNTVVKWTFTDFTNSVSSSCSDTVNVRTKLSMMMDCKDTTIAANEGDCSIEVRIPQRFALHPCTLDTIWGVPYVGSVKQDLTGDVLIHTFRTGVTKLIWVFTDTTNSLVKPVDTCYMNVKIGDNNDMPVNCDNYPSLRKVLVGQCSTDAATFGFNDPTVIDFCTNQEIVPDIYRTSNPTVKVHDASQLGVFSVGVRDTIVRAFGFQSDGKSQADSMFCYQPVWVLDSLNLTATCLPDDSVTVLVAEGTDCKLATSAILDQIGTPKAFDNCLTDSIPGVATLADGSPLPYEVNVGDTLNIRWVFSDKEANADSIFCFQKVTVKSQNEPKFDCESLDTLTYEAQGECFFIMPETVLPIPVAKDACTGTDVKGTPSRTDGGDAYGQYPVGATLVTWTFNSPYSTTPKICTQVVWVKTTKKIDAECTAANYPEIKLMVSNGATALAGSEVLAKLGSHTALNPCNNAVIINGVASREDGLALEDDYQIGTTTIIWTFTDTTNTLVNPTSFCKQTVTVRDETTPEVTCPTVTQGQLSCLGDTVAPYASYTEFKAAGGSIDDESKVDLTSFRSVTSVTGDECQATVTRDYYLTTTKGIEVHCSVPQTFEIKDDVAPVYVGIPSTGISINTSCDAPNDVALTVTAADNCDPAPTVTYVRNSTQGGDPSQCDYYTYDITYTYTAVDRCGNTAEPVVYTIHVKDTLAPIVHAPANWSDSIYPSFLKNCEFGVPDITGLLPADSVFQNCGDNQYLSFWQSPAANDTITETTAIALHVQDVCGNDTVLYKICVVQKTEEILSVYTHNPLVCGTDEAWMKPSSAKNDLQSPSIVEAQGFVYMQDFDGTYFRNPTTVCWDIYHDSISESSLIYSNNPYTYASKFPFSETSLERYKLTLLTRRSQSGSYYYVATDTVTGCNGFAVAEIDVRERPRLHLTSGLWNICDGDSLALQGDFGNNAACINDMGSAIIGKGWIVDDSVYVAQTPLYYADGASRTAIFYATNECGTTTTLNTLYTDCGEGIPVNHADSLAVFGSEANVALAAIDSLYTSDSVDIEVFTHFDPAQVLLTTDPQDKARIWIGDQAELDATMPYDQPEIYRWMKVVNNFDAEQNAVYDKYGNVISGGSLENDDEEISSQIDIKDTLQGLFENGLVITPTDSASYYVVVGNGVCPTVASNLVNIDVMTQLPTAITPYTKDGLNDDFVRGHHVIIFNRYGQQVFEGNDGWDGTYRGILADPGVYFYSVDMAGGVVLKGSVEVVKME